MDHAGSAEKGKEFQNSAGSSVNNIDTQPGWATHSILQACNEWESIMSMIGVKKGPSELTREDLIGKLFDSYEMAELFFSLYAKSMGFGVRKGEMRKNCVGEVKNRTWLCSKEGERDEKYLNLQNRKREARPLTRDGCQVKLRINKKKATGLWVVKEFVVAHSHPLAIPIHRQFISSNRDVSDGALRTANTMRMAGVRTNQIMSYMAQQVGGYNNVRFIIKDLYNKLGKANEVRLGDLDAEKALGYLQAKADQDVHMFAKFTCDSERRLENLLWADSRARSDYSKFGDVLSFDTTYKSNQYGKPLLVFVGVNNHFRSTIFAFAILVNETVETYRWAINTFLECMDYQVPKTVITDGDHAMRTAIIELMPATVHRLCSWHIEQNAISNIKVPGFVSVMKHFMFRHYSPEEFQSRWVNMVTELKLQDNDWVRSIYEKRETWADTYLRKSFFGGMTTTQRCEKMNSFLKSKVMKEMNLCDFLRGMDMALSWLRHKQSEDEFTTLWTKAVTNVTNVQGIEAQAESIFTRRMFYKIRDQMKREGKYIVKSLIEQDSQRTCILQKYGDDKKDRVVTYNTTNMAYSCPCNLFPSKGVPCRHMFAAMKAMHIKDFPVSLICNRWRKSTIGDKDVESQQQQLPKDSKPIDSDKLRFGHVTSKCSEIAFLASHNEEMFRVAVQAIESLGTQLRGMMGISKEEKGNKSPEDLQGNSNKNVRNPDYSKTKGGWVGSRRGGVGRKRCSNCHRLGHNKATCTTANKRQKWQGKMQPDISDNEEMDDDYNVDLRNETDFMVTSAGNENKFGEAISGEPSDNTTSLEFGNNNWWGPPF